ncbi:MAG: hypothetical protein ABSG68_11400 [Thermoguttaceae bacterium]|jgi:hypothetical protein
MPQVQIELTGDEARAWAAIQKIVRGTEEIEAGLAKVGEANRKAAQENKELERAAKSVYESTRTPMERYGAKMTELNALVEKGKIDQDTFGRAAQNAKNSLLEAGEAGKKAFGPELIGQVVNFAKQIVGIGSASALIVQAFQEMQRIKDEAAQEARQSEAGEASLAQLAQGKDLAPLLARSRKAAADYGMSRTEAAQLTFALQSAGQIEQLETFASLRNVGMTNPATMARAAKSFQDAMGADKTGSLRDILSGSGGAAKSTTLRLEEVLEGASDAGASGKAAGVTPQEVLGSVSALGTIARSGGKAGHQANALFRSLGRLQGAIGDLDTDEEGRDVTDTVKKLRAHVSDAMHGAKGSDLFSQLHAIDALKLHAGQLQQVFGRPEALQAYRLLLQNEGTAREATGRVNQGVGEDLIGKMISAPSSDEEIEAAQQARIQKERGHKRLAPLGTSRNLVQAAEDRITSQIWSETNPVLGGLRWARHKLDTAWVSDEHFLGSALNTNALNSGNPEDAQLRADIERKLGLTADKLHGAATNLERSTRGAPTLAPVTADR